MVLRVIVWTAAVVLFNEIPMTEAVLKAAVLALAMVRSMTILPEISLIPPVVVIPLIKPGVEISVFVVPLVSFDTVFAIIIVFPLPSLYIPYTVCDAPVEGDEA